MSDALTVRGTGRARVLDAARRLFVEQGYEATSIADVLDASGVSRGALYHHFENKSDLFAAVLEHLEQQLLTRVTQRASTADGPAAALLEGALAFLDETRDPEVRRLVLVDAPAVLGWAKWRELDSRYAFGALRAALEVVAASGATGLEPDLVESHAHILLAALMELGLLTAQADDVDAARDRAARSITQLINDLLQPRAARRT